MFKFDKLVFGDLGWGDELLFATPITTELPPKNIKYITSNSGTPLTTVV